MHRGHRRKRCTSVVIIREEGYVHKTKALGRLARRGADLVDPHACSQVSHMHSLALTDGQGGRLSLAVQLRKTKALGRPARRGADLVDPRACSQVSHMHSLAPADRRVGKQSLARRLH